MFVFDYLTDVNLTVKGSQSTNLSLNLLEKHLLEKHTRAST